MIDPKALAFDIDGVIADTMHLFIDILSDHYDIHTVKYTDIISYRLDDCLDLEEDVLEGAVARILNGEYRASLQPILGAGSVLRRIGEATGRILMVTARPDPGPIESWINQLLDGQYHHSPHYCHRFIRSQNRRAAGKRHQVVCGGSPGNLPSAQRRRHRTRRIPAALEPGAP